MNVLEESKYIINRYDHYYESINSKGNLYLALNTFIIGGCITCFYSLDKIYHFSCAFKYLFYALIIVNFAATIFTIVAIKPFLSKRKRTNKSLYYFGDVANRTQARYIEEFICTEEPELAKDAISQAYQLASGLNIKFKRINVASVLIGVQIFLIMIFSILITIKL